ncbi:hypothetical protein BJ508DRAFT_382169, partial [Ascobolus immersus RN42]
MMLRKERERETTSGKGSGFMRFLLVAVLLSCVASAPSSFVRVTTMIVACGSTWGTCFHLGPLGGMRYLPETWGARGTSWPSGMKGPRVIKWGTSTRWGGGRRDQRHVMRYVIILVRGTCRRDASREIFGFWRTTKVNKPASRTLHSLLLDDYSDNKASKPATTPRHIFTTIYETNNISTPQNTSQCAPPPPHPSAAASIPPSPSTSTSTPKRPLLPPAPHSSVGLNGPETHPMTRRRPANPVLATTTLWTLTALTFARTQPLHLSLLEPRSRHGARLPPPPRNPSPRIHHPIRTRL